MAIVCRRRKHGRNDTDGEERALAFLGLCVRAGQAVRWSRTDACVAAIRGGEVRALAHAGRRARPITHAQAGGRTPVPSTIRCRLTVIGAAARWGTRAAQPGRRAASPSAIAQGGCADKLRDSRSAETSPGCRSSEETGKYIAGVQGVDMTKVKAEGCNEGAVATGAEGPS